VTQYTIHSEKDDTLIALDTCRVLMIPTFLSELILIIYEGGIHATLISVLHERKFMLENPHVQNCHRITTNYFWQNHM
jgi:hypothetical protein